MKKFNLILVRLGHFNLSIASFFIQFIFTLAILMFIIRMVVSKNYFASNSYPPNELNTSDIKGAGM